MMNIIALAVNLPHGSGVDCKWMIGRYKNDKVYAKNSYHFMDDMGYYCDYADFTVIFNKNFSDFTLEFNGRQSQYLAAKHMLRDYLTNIISVCLEQAKRDNTLYTSEDTETTDYYINDSALSALT